MSDLPFRLLLITNRRLTYSRPLISVLEQALQAGLKAIQLREKDLSAGELYELALQVKQCSLTYHAKLLINERFDIARAVNADGVHLTSQSVPVPVVRKSTPEGNLIGCSTHSLHEAVSAEENRCDYILFGPVFATPEKLKYGPPQGLKRLSDVSAQVQVPVIAVGGITPERARQCMKNGASGVAVISAIMQAKNIKKTVKEFKRYLGSL